jgi:hypothetical protein
VIAYQDYTKSYLLDCDRCTRTDSVRTARDLTQARHIASTFFKWATDTPHGDLCPACASLWRSGALDKKAAAQ